MSDDPKPRETTTTLERRSVVRTVAWTVPVIAASAQAPAFAASCNQLFGGVLDPSQPAQYTRSTLRRADADIPLTSAGGTVGLVLRSDFATYTPRPTNLEVKAAPTGQIPLAGIELGNEMLANQSGSAARNQTITFTFSRTVQDLEFTLTDLDNSSNHRDAVAIEDAPFTYQYGSVSQVQGTGTLTNPFRVVGTVNYNNDTSGAGNVIVRLAGPLTTFSIRYWNADPANTSNSTTQSIFLTRLSLMAYMDGCA